MRTVFEHREGKDERGLKAICRAADKEFFEPITLFGRNIDIAKAFSRIFDTLGDVGFEWERGLQENKETDELRRTATKGDRKITVILNAGLGGAEGAGTIIVKSEGQPAILVSAVAGCIEDAILFTDHDKAKRAAEGMQDDFTVGEDELQVRTNNAILWSLPRDEDLDDEEEE